jgi:pimeloyl-ACP methyl ester carboxylesterase
MIKKGFMWLKKCVLFLAILKVAALALVLLLPSGTPAIRDPQGQVLPESVAVLEKVEIGGLQQWILIRGENAANPILLYLHGGPGNPEMPLAVAAGRYLEEHFTVVHWDQRGAGKTYSPFTPRESMTVDQFVADTKEMTEYLQERLGQKDVYLLGHSWGALVGLKTVAEHPELYRAYIGMGQFTDAIANEEYAYSYVMEAAERAGDKKTISTLSAIGMPPYEQLRDLALLKNKVTLYGGSFHGESSWLNRVTANMLRAKEYTPVDYIRFIAGSRFSAVLMDEVVQFDMFDAVSEVLVPVYFFSGAHDYMTCSQRVEEYYQFLQAPHKEHILFSASAHNPVYEEPERFVNELVRIRNEGY